MSRLTLARVLAVATAALVVVSTGACTSDPPKKAGYCVAAKSAATTCKEPSPCDETLTASCATLGSALSPTALQAAQDCLESGVCGAANCLARAAKTAAPSQAHRDLAESFCTFCAPDVADCETQFYSKKAKLPGGLVLPYGEAVAVAVNEDCTGDRDTCRARFATCATETIARVVGDTLDADVAECVTTGFLRDEVPTGPGGAPTVTTCTSDNCPGCCRDDKCESGSTESACGAGASACETCGGAQKCGTDGRCREPCGPNNCKGCCDGGNCIAGNLTTKCGGDGAACGTCATQGPSFVCSNQTCIDGSCQSTCVNGCCSTAGCQPGTGASACGAGGEACIDCGYGRTCGTAKSCAIDPNALWDLYVSFAVVPDKTKAGVSWDITNGAADPYLIAFSSLGASTHTGQTTVQNDTHVPFWAETPLKGIKAAELLNNTSFEVWDSDFDFDDFIGGCKLPLTPAVFDGSLQSFVCPATASSVSVELYYRIRKPQ